MSANNPYKPGDRVIVKRGGGRLTGTVVKTVLARCHIRLDDCERVIVDNYHDVASRDVYDIARGYQ